MNENKYILKKQTFRKTINLILLKTSYLLSGLLKTPVHWGLPLSLAIEPTTHCNLMCPECPSGAGKMTRAKGNIAPELFRKIIDDNYKTLSYLTLYFQGEPFLYKNIFDLIHYAVSKHIYTATSTNGHFLNPENTEQIIKSGLDKLIISVDGADQASYEKYRVGGNLEKVLEGIKLLVNAKKQAGVTMPVIEIQFLINSYNEHQAEKMKQLSDEIGADIFTVKTMQIYDFEQRDHFLPKNQDYSRYKINDQCEYELKSSLPNKCWRMWTSPVITWDGQVLPCCFDKNAQYTLGSIHDKDLKSIWRSTAYHNFRKQILSSRKSIDICTNCTEGLKQQQSLPVSQSTDYLHNTPVL